jgi:hypothetical protein
MVLRVRYSCRYTVRLAHYLLTVGFLVAYTAGMHLLYLYLHFHTDIRLQRCLFSTRLLLCYTAWRPQLSIILVCSRVTFMVSSSVRYYDLQIALRIANCAPLG